MTTSERSPRPSAPRSGDARPRRYYAVDKDLRYSLRDGARALELPEGTLRRAILLEELPAQAVDDDRQYLLEGSVLQDYLRTRRPSELCMFPGGDSLIQDLVTVFAIPVGLAILLFLNWTPAAPSPAAGKRRVEPSGEIQSAPPPAKPSEPSPMDPGVWFPEYFNLPN